jgi:putative peptidoglycan lipid II flippase
MARAGVRLRPTYRFLPGTARKAAGLAGAGIGALLAQQVAVLTVVYLAGNRGGPGTLPTYHYAQAVYLLPYAVLAVPLATAAFPHLAHAAARKDHAALIEGTAGTTRAVFAVSALGAAVLVAAAPGVEQLFAAIDPGTVDGLARTLTLFAPGLVGFGLMAHLQRVLYAAGRPKVAVGASALGWLVMAGVAAVLAGMPVLQALGLGSMVGMSVAGLGLVAGTGWAVGPGSLAGLARTAVAALGFGAVGAVGGRVVTDQLLGQGVISALVAGIAGAVVAALATGFGVLAADRSIVRALPRGSET